MAERAPILYRDFYDVPRVFWVCYSGKSYLFDSAFDEEADEYRSTYKVYLMSSTCDLPPGDSWIDLHKQALAYFGEVSVSSVRFDETLRKEIDVSVIDDLRST
jgi:hypothetical protein